MSRLWIVRHSQTLFNDGDTVHVNAREQLTEYGDHSAEIFANFYTHAFDDYIAVTSERSRTKKLLSLLQHTNKFSEIVHEEWFNERQYGQFENKTKQEIFENLYAQGLITHSFGNFSELMNQKLVDATGTPYFEYNELFAERIQHTWDSISHAYPERNFLLSLHGGTIRALLCVLLWVTWHEVDALLYKTNNKIPNLSSTILEYDRVSSQRTIEKLAHIDSQLAQQL